MVEMYVSWIKGLPRDKETLGILRKNNLGVEMSGIDEEVEMLQDAGVRFSAHTPGLNLTLNLAKPDFADVFKGEQGKRLLQVIRSSDAKIVGFHSGYSAAHVYKMMAFPNVPTPETIITDRQTLLEIFANNLLKAFSEINRTGWKDFELDHKTIVVETLDYSREKDVDWSIQRDEAKEHKGEIEQAVREYGINAGILHVTEPDFVRSILEKTDASVLNPDRDNPPVEFLFDVAHNFISWDAKKHHGRFQGTALDYFQKMVNVVKGRISQLHLTVPVGDDKIGYSDRHHQFTPGNRLSDEIMDLTKLVYKSNNWVRIITLEIKEPAMSPVDHAKRMVEQAEYIAKELNL